MVLTGISEAYLPLLRSFACQLQQLHVSPLIVAAYDEEAYIGALEQVRTDKMLWYVSGSTGTCPRLLYTRPVAFFADKPGGTSLHSAASTGVGHRGAWFGSRSCGSLLLATQPPEPCYS